jgi:hypothetical protein
MRFKKAITDANPWLLREDPRDSLLKTLEDSEIVPGVGSVTGVRLPHEAIVKYADEQMAKHVSRLRRHPTVDEEGKRHGAKGDVYAFGLSQRRFTTKTVDRHGFTDKRPERHVPTVFMDKMTDRKHRFGVQASQWLAGGLEKKVGSADSAGLPVTRFVEKPKGIDMGIGAERFKLEHGLVEERLVERSVERLNSKSTVLDDPELPEDSEDPEADAEPSPVLESLTQKPYPVDPHGLVAFGTRAVPQQRAGPSRDEDAARILVPVNVTGERGPPTGWGLAERKGRQVPSSKMDSHRWIRSNRTGTVEFEDRSNQPLLQHVVPEHQPWGHLNGGEWSYVPRWKEERVEVAPVSPRPARVPMRAELFRWREKQQIQLEMLREQLTNAHVNRLMHY